MKKILFVGKINESVKDIEELLEKHFRVQICQLHTEAVADILKVVTPDLIVVSLAGVLESDSRIFEILSKEYRDIPVLTIGTDEEKGLVYGANSHFENIPRPADKRTVMEAVCSKVDASLVI